MAAVMIRFLKALRHRLRCSSRRAAQRGVALVMVLGITVIVTKILSEILFQTQIAARASVGERDRVNAEAAALTGTQFVKMLIALELAIPDQVKGVVMQQLGGKHLFQLLDGVPIGGEALSQIEDLSSIKINRFLDAGLLEALNTIPGFFVVTTSDESGKIDLNLAAMRNTEERLLVSLQRIFSGEWERKFLEEKGYSPERLAANIVDYIDTDSRTRDDGSDEASVWEQAKFPFGPRNGAMESLDELRRVPGFHDDDIFNVFAPYFTVWPVGRHVEQPFNLNAAPVELVAALATGSGETADERSLDEFEDKKAAGEKFDQKRDISKYWQNFSGGAKVPDEIQRMTRTTSEVYKIEVQGVSGNVSRKYTLVIHMEDKTDAGGPASRPTPKPTPPGGRPPPGGATPTPPPAAAGSSRSGSKPFEVLYRRFQ